MSRPLRIEFPGALYHITSRGNERGKIYWTDGDREDWLEIFADVCRQFNWICHAYCLMGNHYHLLVETPESNLSFGMRQLNGIYTQRFNRRHKRVGHLYQGRYKGILVQKQSYLLELARYVVLNPVRARMVRTAGQWRWSSYRITAGFETSLPWLNVEWLLSQFSQRRKTACERYQQFIAEGAGQPSPWEALKNQVYLGDDRFVQEMQSILEPGRRLDEIPLGQKRKLPKSLGDYLEQSKSRNEAIVNAWMSGGYKMSEIADYFKLHYSSVSKIVKRVDDSRFKT